MLMAKDSNRCGKESNAPLADDPLGLAFPCRWTYRLIGADADAMVRAAEGVLAEVQADLPHWFQPGNQSRTGKYSSISLDVTDEPTRRLLAERLAEHTDVKMLL